MSTQRSRRRAADGGRLCVALAGLLGTAFAPAARAQPGDALESAGAILARARAVVAGAETAYVSDYISFAGADAAGRVAFALDTNRGRERGEHQAEHFTVMYDERTGWVDLEGYTEFANPDGALLGWPDSPYFELAGEPYAIDALRSPVNDLELRVGALEPRVTETSAATLFSMASAPATLVWNGRTIAGRVIYEYLAMRDANRLAGGIGGALAMLTDGPDFQGLYLTTTDGELYVHRAGNAAATSTGDPLSAFWTRNGRSLPVTDPDFDVTDHDAALGLYRWPAAWHVQWQSECGTARLDVRSLDHDTQTNWIAGGFAIRFVEGTLGCGDESLDVYGFAELIR